MLPKNSNHSITAGMRKLSIFPFLLLAACGGGASETDGSTSSFSTLEAEAAALSDKYLVNNGQINPSYSAIASSEIPVSAVVTYGGFIQGLSDGKKVIGEVTIEANFGNSNLSGSATNFKSSDNVSLSGTLSGNSSINRTGSSPSQIQMTLDGMVNGRTSALALDGDFLVEAGNTDIVAVGGQVEGVLAGTVFEEGSFIAE